MTNKLREETDAITINNIGSHKIELPLCVDWQPTSDITAYELAKLIPFLFRARPIYRHDLPSDESLLRHFFITDPNNKSNPMEAAAAGDQDE